MKSVIAKQPETASKSDLYALFEDKVLNALQYYSNVHRGSGVKSMVSTHLFEEARSIVLKTLGLHNKGYTVIFCSPVHTDILKRSFRKRIHKVLSSRDIGLSLGVTAIIIKRARIPGGRPIYPGGGTARLTSRNWIIWDRAPAKYEPGTPAIINVIAFAIGLKLLMEQGIDRFPPGKLPVKGIESMLESDGVLENNGAALHLSLQEKFIGKDLIVPVERGEKRYMNFDSSASTPTTWPVWEVFREHLYVSDEHRSEVLTEVKKICAKFLNAPVDQYDFFFTSNTTEAINLASEGICGANENKRSIRTIISLLEHTSNDLPWRAAQDEKLYRVPVDDKGMMDLSALEEALSLNQSDSSERRLLAISGASNVLGTCNPLKAISGLAHKHGTPVLVDAAQLIAHRSIDMKADDIDLLAFSAHKVYAPFGAGVLVAKKDLLQFDEERRNFLEQVGLENTAGTSALGAILLLLHAIGMDIVEEEEKKLTAYLLDRLHQITGVKLYGISNSSSEHFNERIGVVPFTLDGMIAHKSGKLLSSKGGIGIRTGCHCAHIIVKHILGVGSGLERFQWVLQHLFPNIDFPGVARMSLGLENTKEEIDQVLETIHQILSEYKENKENNKNKTNNPFKSVISKDLQSRYDQLLESITEQVYGQLS